MILPQENASQRPPVAAVELRLRLLATTDLHANLLPFDYFTDTRAPHVGLARLVGLIARLRAEVGNTLLFDNGDTLQGTPLADAAVAEIVPSGGPHPMIAAMNALRFDAATIGNHDFDFGLPHLEKVLAAADFPFLSANSDHADGTPFLPRGTILERRFRDTAGQAQTLRIGVTGCLPPQVAIWNRHSLQGRMGFADMVSRVSQAVATLRADGADIVVVLAHSGLGSGNAASGAENAALQIAEIAGVDAVISGHTHRVAPGATPQAVTGTPIVQPGAFGSHLGCIDLTLSRPRPVGAAAARWHVRCAESAALPAPAPAPGDRRHVRDLMREYPQLHTGLARDHRAARHFAARPLGESAIRLETYFSVLAPCAVTQIVADAQLAAVRPMVQADPALRDLPLLSAAAPFRAGGRAGPGNFTDIPAGSLKLRHAADLYVYPNMLSLVRITGQGIRDWLERAASLYNRIDPHADAPQTLIDHEFAPYNFDRLVGLRYQIDVSCPQRTNVEGDEVYRNPGRIRDLRFADGLPLAPDAEVLVVTNSYRAAGGGHVRAAGEATDIPIPSVSVRDAVARHISDAAAPLDPVVAPTWSLVPLGGVTVTFDTGPRALGCTARWTKLGLTPLDDPDPDGAKTQCGPKVTAWQRFRLLL